MKKLRESLGKLNEVISQTDHPVLIMIICVVTVLGIVFGAVSLEAWLLMLVWNAIVPSLFSGPAFTFWQTMGIIFLLNALSGLLFRRRPSED